MFEIEKIENKLLKNESLTQKERLEYINYKKVDAKVLKYLQNLLKNLTIELNSYKSGSYKREHFENNILYLMQNEILNHWCFETTNAAIVLFNETDYIERGIVTYDEEGTSCEHAWICFKYENEEYVFDPAFNIICKKSIYKKIFETKVLGIVYSKDCLEYLIRKLNEKKEVEEPSYIMKSILKKCDKDVIEKENELTFVMGSIDINSPIYTNNNGYKAEIDNGHIKKLFVKFYSQG